MAILNNSAPLKVYWHAPAPIFVARVNMPGGIAYPIQDIPYDGVTVGAYTALAADMFFTLGSAEGLDDLGRGRLRAAPTSSLLKVGRSSQGYEDGQLNVVNDAWIHVYPDYRVHAKIATIQNYVEYKDTDLAVADRTELPPPICNMGTDYAGSIDADTGLLRVLFPGSLSRAVADGATITGWAWDAGGGTFVGGTSATDDDVLIDFAAGVYWVTLTVTDSNGKTTTGRRLVLADDPADSLCVSGMQVQGIDRSDSGNRARLRLLQDLPRSQYPDGAKVIIWEDRDPAIYGEPDPASRDHMLYVGWHQTDNASARALETHLQRETVLTCVDILGRLNSLPGWDQRIEVPDAEAGLTWGEMPNANMDKFLCYLPYWHSTALTVADFYPSGTWDEYPFVLFDSAGATLYEQMQRQANRLGFDHDFMSDRFGALMVSVNPQFQNAEDRTAAFQNSVTVQSWSEIDFTYNRPPRVHTTRGSALLTQSEWVIDDDEEKQLLSPVFAIAPGTAPGQGGREATLGERLVKSQQELNDVLGHHHAHSNARYGPFTVTLNINADPWDFDPADRTWVHFIVTAAYAPQRGIDFETTRALCKEVSIDFSYPETGREWRARVTLEIETVGLPAITEVQEEALPVGEQPVAPYVPDIGLIVGQELVAGIGADGYVYRTADFQTPASSGGPTWDRVSLGSLGEIYSWVVDPFSPGYIDGAGEINGWIATWDKLYRVEDVFGTPSATAVFTFDQVVALADGHWRSIQASFGAFFAANNPWLLCVSYYGNAAGHTGTWALRSLDGGATWEEEVLISEHYDVTLGDFLPVGLYTSPKTPGLAYTCAYLETGSPSLADGFVSTDWGATWTAISGAPEDDAILQLPRWRVWDTNNSVYFAGSTLSGRASTTVDATASGNGGNDEHDSDLVCGAPADAVRVTIQGRWTSAWSRVSTPSVTSLIDPDVVGAGLGQTSDLSHSLAPAPGGFTSQDFDLEWLFTLSPGNDWPNNRDVILSSVTLFGAFMNNYCEVSTGTGESGSVTNTVSLRVLEIELDDGTIYTPPVIGAGWLQPGEGFAGSIHIPWPDNASEEIGYYGHIDRLGDVVYTLIESIAGVQTDISPTDGGVSYGVNAYGFTVRSYDSDRNYMAIGGIGNDAGTHKVGLWVSSNAGAAWTNILAPVAATNALYGLQIAFAGDDPDCLYAWGGYSDGALAAIYYSDDFGATLDDRSGNLESSFGGVAYLGICGGPPP